MQLGLPVGELLARTTSAELTEWMAYFILAGEDTGQSAEQQRSMLKGLRG